MGVGFLAGLCADRRAFDAMPGLGLYVVGFDGLHQRPDFGGLVNVVLVPGGELIDPHQGQQPQHDEAEGGAGIHAQTPSPQPALT